MVLDGLVRHDPAARTLTVLRPDNLSGYQKLAWRSAHEALVRAEQGGWSSDHPYLSAHGVGQRDIAHGLPVDNLGLQFHFPTGVAAYGELVSLPGLTSYVTIDRSRGQFVSVRFRHGLGD
jgi:hypothetical protein